MIVVVESKSEKSESFRRDCRKAISPEPFTIIKRGGRLIVEGENRSIEMIVGEENGTMLRQIGLLKKVEKLIVKPDELIVYYHQLLSDATRLYHARIKHLLGHDGLASRHNVSGLVNWWESEEVAAASDPTDASESPSWGKFGPSIAAQRRGDLQTVEHILCLRPTERIRARPQSSAA